MNKQFEYQSKSFTNKRIKREVTDEEENEDNSTDTEVNEDVMNEKETAEEIDQEMSEEPNLPLDNEECGELAVKVMAEVFKCSVDGCNKLMFTTEEVRDHWKTVHRLPKADNDKNVTNTLTSTANTIPKVINITNTANQPIPLPLVEPLPQPLIIPPTFVPNQPTIIKALQCSVNSCAKVCANMGLIEEHWKVEHKNIKCLGPLGINILLMAEPPNVNSGQVGPTFTAIPSLPAQTIPSIKPKPKISSIMSNIKREPMTERKLLHLGQGKGLNKQSLEILLNLYDYFSKAVDPSMVVREVSDASRVGIFTIYRLINEFRTTGTFTEPKTTKNKEKKYKRIPEDREIVSRCLYKLKEENRLRGPNSVFNEIKNSNQYNPTFKKCGQKTFVQIFKDFGFKIFETKIMDHKPEDVEREKVACSNKDPTGEYYLCDWPECRKRISARGQSLGFNNHMAQHLRTHTGVKPYVCRFPKCQYRCAISVNFTKHLRIHHKSVFEADDDHLV